MYAFIRALWVDAELPPPRMWEVAILSSTLPQSPLIATAAITVTQIIRLNWLLRDYTEERKHDFVILTPNQPSPASPNDITRVLKESPPGSRHDHCTFPSAVTTSPSSLVQR